MKAPQKRLNKEEKENKARGEVQGRLKGRRASGCIVPCTDP